MASTDDPSDEQKLFWLMIRVGDPAYVENVLSHKGRSFVRFRWVVPGIPGETVADTPLHQAVRWSVHDDRRDNMIRIIDILMGQSDADPNAVDSDGERPIERALILKADIRVLRALWHPRPTVTWHTLDVCFASNSEAAVVNFLLDAAPKDVLRSTGPGGQTLLSSAMANGTRNAAGRLVVAGADVNAPLPDGLTPLVSAMHNGLYSLAELLIQHGANLDAAHHNGRSVLMYALECEADPQHAHRYLATTIIHRRANLNYVAPNGATALYVAIQFRLHRMVRLLLAKGADPNLIGGDQLLPLSAAVVFGDVESVDILTAKVLHGTLFAYGVNIDAQDNEGYTALMHARDTSITDLLIQRGASIAPVNAQGQSALCVHLAAGAHAIARSILRVAGARATVDVARVTELALRAAGDPHATVDALDVLVDVGGDPTTMLIACLDRVPPVDNLALAMLLRRGAQVPNLVHPHEHGTVVAERRAALARDASSWASVA